MTAPTLTRSEWLALRATGLGSSDAAAACGESNVSPAELVLRKGGISGIYAIRNSVNGWAYVGQAVDFDRRWRVHRGDLNKGTHHCRPLQRAWIEHGETAFVFEVIEAIERNKKILDSREQVYLDAAFATGLAYNLALTASSCLGMRRSTEARAKMSAAMKGNKNFLHRKLTPEYRANMSAAQKGHKRGLGTKRSPEARANISAAMKGNKNNLGNKHTPEARAKVSAANKGHKRGVGRKRTPESRAKMAATMKGKHLGRKHTTETRAKVSAALKGNKRTLGAKLSPEHRAKVSAGLKAYHANKKP